MKFTKLSLAALIAMGIASNASALENVKVDGSVKLWYQTMDTDANKDSGLFKQAGAQGDLVAKLRATGDLTKNVGFGTTIYAATTLGLEQNLVQVEALNLNAGSANGQNTLSGEDNLPMWLGEAYMTYKAGKTLVKIGRMELDTPLAFSETWNAAPNTFEAALLVNQDLPDTTLIAAYVSRGNGFDNNLAVNRGTVNGGKTGFTSYWALNALGNGAMALGGADNGGAYAAAMVNKSIPNLTLHPVYYSLQDTANAFWIDATYVVPKIVKIEALYSNLDTVGATEMALRDVLKVKTSNGGTDYTTDAWGVQLSGEFSGVKLAGAYTSVSKGFLPVANTATGFKKTKLYTASIFSDGEVAAKPDTDSWKLSASTSVAGFDLSASYGSYSVGKNDGQNDWFGARNAQYDPSEIDLSVGTKIGDINLVAYYINQSEFNSAKQDRQAVRVIATINF
jgi:imipenem/basic amino acid-specific outer membrane pore